VVIDIPEDSTTGKRKWISIPGIKRDAEKALTEYLHQQDTGTFVEPTKMILSDYLDK
jgi:hypothetical protein